MKHSKTITLIRLYLLKIDLKLYDKTYSPTNSNSNTERVCLCTLTKRTPLIIPKIIFLKPLCLIAIVHYPVAIISSRYHQFMIIKLRY